MHFKTSIRLEFLDIIFKKIYFNEKPLSVFLSYDQRRFSGFVWSIGTVFARKCLRGLFVKNIL